MTPADEEGRRRQRWGLPPATTDGTGPEVDALARIAAAVCSAPMALVHLADSHGQTMRGRHGMAEVTDLALDAWIRSHAMPDNGPLEIPDARLDPVSASDPFVASHPQVRFYAAAPVILASGERVGTVCVMDTRPRELTQLQRGALGDVAQMAQQALLRWLSKAWPSGLEPRFQAISYASPLGIFEADASGAFTLTNGRFDELVGSESAASRGQGWLRSVHPDDRDRVAALWQRAVASGEPFDQEFSVRGRGDAWQGYVRMQARAGVWGDPPAAGYVGVVGDITRRRETERELRTAKQFLERAESLSGVGGWEADLVTRKVKWTDQNCRIYDLEAGHVPDFDEHLRYFDAAARERMVQTAQLALRSGQPWDLELPMVTAGGRQIWVRSVGRAEFESGRAVRLVGALQDITAQKASEDALRSANALLATVVDSLPCGLSVFDGDLRLVSHNRQFRTLLDFPDRLFSAKNVNFEDLIRYNAERGEYGPGPPAEAVRRIVAQARDPQAHHIQRTRPGGVTLDIRGAPLPAGGFVTTYVDISAARAAEVALMESEEMKQRALDASRLALWDMDLRNGRLYLSENWLEMLGGPRQPLVTTPSELARRVPAEDRERVSRSLVAMLKGAVAEYDVEHRVRRDDGTQIWIRSMGRVTERDGHGRALRVTGTNRDITPRKRAQEELARTAAINHATLESTADGIVVVTMAREILLVNRRFLSLWSIPASLGHADQAGMLAHVQTQLKEPQRYAERVRALYEDGGQESFELVELLDGRVFEQYGRPVEVDGAIIGRLWSFRDVTQRIHVEAEIRRAKDAAEAASRAKSEFLDTMSHEIRTPLNGVIGMTRLLRDSQLDPAQRRYVELAHSSGQALLSLINDLLDLGKIEAGRIEFEAIEFGVGELVRELAELHGLRAREKDLDFVLQLAPELPVALVGDPGRLRQVLNNLLGNAVKFTQRGRVELHVERLGDQAERATLRFTVRDTGIGIAPEVQQRLFQRFAQADSSTTREFGGTGLGLAIVKQLCEQLGGSVRLTSTPGVGAAFSVELPFVLAGALSSSAGGPMPNRTAPVPVSKSNAIPSRILVAEDNATNQIVVQGMLERAGYGNVTMVGDGQQVLGAVAGQPFDAILMDCRMPVMDGYEAAAKLRARGWQRPIIALTANVSDEQRQKCLAAGMDDFLCKPLDPDQLAKTLSRWLRPHGAAAFARDKALERMGGDLELFQRALDSFVVLAPQTLARIRIATQAGESDSVHRQLHSLAGSASMMSAESLAELAAELELLAADGQLALVASELDRLRAALDDFLKDPGVRSAGP